MPRRRRVTVPNIPVHVMQRGHNKNACFYQNADYAVYLDKLKEATAKYKVKVHCFVLMTNHVHLLMTAECHNGISLVMQSLGRYYVRYINTTYKRSGTMWEGRYKSSIVDSDEYLLTLYQYIELNPVRAKMVTHPKNYPWSSYHTNGGNKSIRFVEPHWLYVRLGATTQERRKRYNDLLIAPLSEEKIKWISTTTDKSRVLGDQKFTQQISQQLERYIGYLNHGGDRRSEQFKSLLDSSLSLGES